METKICNVCGIEKTIDNYYKNGKYYRYCCKKCWDKKSIEYAEKKDNVYKKRYYLAHKKEALDRSKKQKQDRLYRIYNGIKTRCYNKNSKNYKNYGQKGIIMCDQWLNDFLSFKLWAISNGYQDTLTIDRIDNSGNYEPSNCRWATIKEQQNNRTNNVYLKHKDKIKTLTQWSEELNISTKKIRKMANQNGEF